MSKLESLGIRTLESVHWYVNDLERARRFYVEKLDFQEIGKSSADLEQRGKQKTLVFRAGDAVLVCMQPVGEGGRAWRFLRKHPEGVGTLNFEVEDVEKAFRLLESRGGTAIEDIQTYKDSRGNQIRCFSIVTPFGDTTFRFLQRDGYRDLFPGMETYAVPQGGQNLFGFQRIDHVTTNFQTLAPALLWMEHVLGLERFWDIQFHTDDVAHKKQEHGSGLRSVVMWDPKSGVKFANNEPWRPNFKASQINLFVEDHHGDGVQHLALATKDILSAVRGLRERQVAFMPTPGSYYDMLPERIQRLGIKKIDEDVDVLRRLEVLVDGDREKSYLLQIFLKEGTSQFKDVKAGPFFYELIQRKGDQGFGGGNFRALFESIERDQKIAGRV